MVSIKAIIKIVIIIVSTGMTIGITIRGLYWLSNYKRPQLMGVAIMRVDTPKKLVALTFDDGPNPPFTDSILNILSRKHINATFFVIGKNAAAHTAVLKRMADNGNEIGNHSWSHEDLIFRSPSYVKQEIEKNDSIIRNIGYNHEIYFRAPHGRKLLLLPWILSNMHKTHILFDVVPIDWEQHLIETMLNRVKTAAGPGSIILLHDGGGDRSTTVKLTESIIDTLKRRGFEFVTVSKLISSTKK
jgi:peptidoglycan-N-acetylglucosamine deacetylase